MCLDCGYRGRELQGERILVTFTCPSCQADLYARPARSYAEMEGLEQGVCDSPVFSGDRRSGEASVTECVGRWSGRSEWTLIVLLSIVLVLALSGGILGALS